MPHQLLNEPLVVLVKKICDKPEKIDPLPDVCACQPVRMTCQSNTHNDDNCTLEMFEVDVNDTTTSETVNCGIDVGEEADETSDGRQGSQRSSVLSADTSSFTSEQVEDVNEEDFNPKDSHEKSSIIQHVNLTKMLFQYLTNRKNVSTQQKTECHALSKVSPPITEAQNENSIQDIQVVYKNPVFRAGARNFYSISKGVEREFLILLRDEPLEEFRERYYLIRSICLRFQSEIEIPRRILCRRGQGRWRKYLIVRIWSPSLVKLENLAATLKTRLTTFKDAVPYKSATMATLYCSENFPDNAELTFTSQRTSRVSSWFGALKLRTKGHCDAATDRNERVMTEMFDGLGKRKSKSMPLFESNVEEFHRELRGQVMKDEKERQQRTVTIKDQRF